MTQTKKNKELKKPVIFPGHGGEVNGSYISKHKMHVFEDGTEVREGVINRSICFYMAEFLRKKGFPFFYPDTELDTPLGVKTQIAERYHSTFSNCFLLDVHNNAGGGTGSEVFTSPGQTESDLIATAVYDAISQEMGSSWNMRHDYSDSDPDKESEFYVLMNTFLPSVLVECGFMDTRSDAEFVLSTKGQRRFGRALANAVLGYNGWKRVSTSEKLYFEK